MGKLLLQDVEEISQHKFSQNFKVTAIWGKKGMQSTEIPCIYPTRQVLNYKKKLHSYCGYYRKI